LRNTDNQTIPLSFQIHLNDVSLSEKTCVKRPGVLTDSKLDLTSHVQLMRNKLPPASHLLFKIRKFVPIAVLKSYTVALFIFIYNTVLCHGVQLTIPSYNL